MDDDLKVTEKTDLEKLLEIIEDLNFDLIGAMFENSWFQIIILFWIVEFEISLEDFVLKPTKRTMPAKNLDKKIFSK